MRNLFVIIAFLSVSVQSLLSQSPDFQLPVFQQKVDSVFDDWNQPNMPGGSIAVVIDGNVVLKKGYGLANVQHNIPNNTATAFNAASISKQFTAMCIALLEEQGKLSLDDEIHRYFPEFQFKEKITVRHLLTHTSGIREASVLAVLAGKANLITGRIKKKFETTENLVSLISKQKDLNFLPGDEHAYTNVNFILLGEIVRKVSGMSLRNFADKHIFQPLQMNNTYFNDNTTKIITKKATGYRYKEKKKKFKKTGLQDSGIVGDHNLITTVEDLIIWQQNFYANKLGKQSPGLIEKMQTRFVLNNRDTIHYGLGLYVTRYKNRWQTVSHGGDDDRYTSFIIRFPNQHISIICLSNIARYDATESKVFAIADILLSATPAKKDSAKIPYVFTSYEKSYFDDKTGNYTGISKKNAFWFHQIQVVDNKPYWMFGGNQKTKKELHHIGNQHFVVKIDEPDAFLEVWFTKMPDGNTQLHEKFRNDTLSFMRKPVLSLSDKALKQFTGKYLNEEINGTIRVKVKKQSLIFSKGIIKIKTIAVSPDTFYAPDNRAFFRFFSENEKGYRAFLVDAIDFRNFRFEK